MLNLYSAIILLINILTKLNMDNIQGILAMKSKNKILLVIDGVVNLIPGLLLLLLPAGLVQLLGLPSTNTYFYTTILGAVIFGIGLALLIELYGTSARIHGLGLGGAIGN